MEKIVLLGCGGHAKSIMDSIEFEKKYDIVGLVGEKDDLGITYGRHRVFALDQDLGQIYRSGITNAFIGIGYMGRGEVREKLYRKLKKIGFIIPNIIDATATIANDVELEDGIYIGKGAILNSACKIGKMAIINTGAIVEHECEINEFSHIAVGAVVCGQSKIGKKTMIGANATVIQNIKIGDYAIVGAGTVVKHDLNSGMVEVSARNCCYQNGDV